MTDDRTRLRRQAKRLKLLTSRLYEKLVSHEVCLADFDEENAQWNKLFEMIEGLGDE